MSKKTLIVILTLVLLGASVAFVLLADDEAAAPITTTTTPTARSIEKPAPTDTAGAYVEYSDGIIAKTDGIKVLFFHAPWCPQCRSIEEGITTDTIPANTTIIKVDYDSNQALRQKYGVTIQTTFVKVNDQGELVEKFVAYQEPTFASVKENLL